MPQCQCFTRQIAQGYREGQRPGKLMEPGKEPQFIWYSEYKSSQIGARLPRPTDYEETIAWQRPRSL
ncbi:MAG: hypothetical protein AUG45_08400 [Ktedonobacter sp. 13_1_20CM_3_54_15]|nr:MAG: hypothetical protein AUG45_08400 [Ktedonobacter sp. 13_1_20CM_3_54_15]